jgi:hypothetical protein
VNVALRAPYNAGRHTVRIENTGSDWIVFDGLKLSPFGPDAKVQALSESAWMMARVTSPHPLASLGLSGLKLADGAYRLTSLDLDSGKIVKTKARIKGSKTVANLKLEGKDYILLFERG